MGTRVKRGLGLLVVAVIAFLVLNVTVRIADAQNEDGTQALGVVFLVLSIAVTLAMIAALLVGLVLVAWGLLRD